MKVEKGGTLFAIETMEGHLIVADWETSWASLTFEIR